MKKKLVSLLLVLVMTICLAAPAVAAPAASPAKLPVASNRAGLNLGALLGNLESWLNNCLNAPGGTQAKPTPTPVPTKKPVPTPTPMPTAKPTPTPAPVPTEKPADTGGQSGICGAYAQEVLRLVNAERAANGLAALRLNSSLCNVAQVKAQDMKDKRYFSHTSPTYGSPFDMMRRFGVTYVAAGENIAMGYRTPAAVMQGWMNSSGHRANILSGKFTQMGIGYVESGNYWCQMFIG